MFDFRHGVPIKSPSNPFSGIEIYSNPHMPEFEPKISLKFDLPISEKVRNKVNKNLLELFGEQRVFYNVNNAIYAHPNNVEFLKKESLKNV